MNEETEVKWAIIAPPMPAIPSLRNRLLGALKRLAQSEGHDQAVVSSLTSQMPNIIELEWRDIHSGSMTDLYSEPNRVKILHDAEIIFVAVDFYVLAGNAPEFGGSESTMRDITSKITKIVEQVKKLTGKSNVIAVGMKPEQARWAWIAKDLNRYNGPVFVPLHSFEKSSINKVIDAVINMKSSMNEEKNVQGKQKSQKENVRLESNVNRAVPVIGAAAFPTPPPAPAPKWTHQPESHPKELQKIFDLHNALERRIQDGNNAVGKLGGLQKNPAVMPRINEIVKRTEREIATVKRFVKEELSKLDDKSLQTLRAHLSETQPKNKTGLFSHQMGSVLKLVEREINSRKGNQADISSGPKH